MWDIKKKPKKKNHTQKIKHKPKTKNNNKKTNQFPSFQKHWCLVMNFFLIISDYWCYFLRVSAEALLNILTVQHLRFRGMQYCDIYRRGAKTSFPKTNLLGAPVGRTATASGRITIESCFSALSLFAASQNSQFSLTNIQEYFEKKAAASPTQEGCTLVHSMCWSSRLQTNQ